MKCVVNVGYISKQYNSDAFSGNYLLDNVFQTIEYKKIKIIMVKIISEIKYVRYLHQRHMRECLKELKYIYVLFSLCFSLLLRTMQKLYHILKNEYLTVISKRRVPQTQELYFLTDLAAVQIVCVYFSVCVCLVSMYVNTVEVSFFSIFYFQQIWYIVRPSKSINSKIVCASHR